MLTQTQYEYLEEEYGNLIHKVAMNISGDAAISSHEDNVQDLWISVMDAIKAYSKKEGKTYDEVYNSDGFGKYLKTVLWNRKASKGKKISQRYNITRDTVDIVDNQDVLQKEDMRVMSPSMSLQLLEFGEYVDSETSPVVKAVLKNPDVLSEKGKVNISAVSKELGVHWYQGKKLIQKLSQDLKNHF